MTLNQRKGNKYHRMTIPIVLMASVTFLWTGCATEPGRGTGVGAGVGAAVGAVTGAVVGNNVKGVSRTEGAVAGAVLGGLLGGVVGNQKDAAERQNTSVNQRLGAVEQQANTAVVNIPNSNGSTTFYYWHDGTGAPLPYRFTSDDAVTHIAAPGVVQSGMYGVGEYVQYAGYNYVNPTNDPLNLSSPQPVGSRDDWLYNQYIDPYVSGGFSLADFQAEIDAGRPVLVHIEEHTMLGYAYDPNNTNIFVYDTWGDIDGAGPYTDGQNPGVLTWGGYYQGAQHYGVTVLELLGGEQTQYVPEPSSVVLAAFGFLVLALATRRRRLKR